MVRDESKWREMKANGERWNGSLRILRMFCPGWLRAAEHKQKAKAQGTGKPAHVACVMWLMWLMWLSGPGGGWLVVAGGCRYAAAAARSAQRVHRPLLPAAALWSVVLRRTKSPFILYAL
jgi:hypothetical protein